MLNNFVKYYEKYMMLMGIMSQAAIYIQAYIIYKNRSATDVSFLSFSIICISLCSWLIYGLLIKNRILIVSNVIAVIGSILVLLAIMKYS